MANQADLEYAIREAIAEDQLELFYQPITRATDSSVIGLEALLRWNRPGLGLVPPDDFIPFAERSDLIIAIDRWVIRQVARQLALWAAMFDTAPVPVSINVSGRHLGFDEFTSNVLLPLEEFRIDPAWVVIEVTESSVLDDLGDAAAKLQILRSHGIRVAIDDFGTGYTSLAHLRTLPIDILKIDRSFTGDPDAESLVKLIIDTGHLLGARITAEGIETDAQARQLAALGADELQGYLFGRPCAPVHLTDDRIIALPFAPR
jgi:EAL domain-containing protein (putative c-di-GMP-specific phosphodiesterase class I)